MIFGTNLAIRPCIALLGAIGLHLALLVAASVWLAPLPKPITASPPAVLLVVLQHATAPIPAATTTAVNAPQAPVAVPVNTPLPLSQQKMSRRRAATPRTPAVHAAVPKPPSVAAPAQPVAPVTPSMPSTSSAQSATPGFTPIPVPAAVPEVLPVAASTGVTISAAYAARNRKPDYPLMARRYNEQGTAVLRVLVTAGGTAGEVRIEKSSGHPLLDESALKAVRDWRFSAATRDGKAVSEWYEISIPYILQN